MLRFFRAVLNFLATITAWTGLPKLFSYLFSGRLCSHRGHSALDAQVLPKPETIPQTTCHPLGTEVALSKPIEVIQEAGSGEYTFEMRMPKEEERIWEIRENEAIMITRDHQEDILQEQEHKEDILTNETMQKGTMDSAETEEKDSVESRGFRRKKKKKTNSVGGPGQTNGERKKGGHFLRNRYRNN